MCGSLCRLRYIGNTLTVELLLKEATDELVSKTSTTGILSQQR